MVCWGGRGPNVYREIFSGCSKERMTKLVANLQKALGERIQGLEWMSEETKVKALEKLLLST